MNHVRIRSIALAVPATLTALAFAASSASALPEFGQCYKKGPGSKYTEASCVTKATTKRPGEYEWRKATAIEAAKRKFSGTGGEVHLYGLYRVCEPSFSVRAQKCHEGETEGTFSLPVECTSEFNQGEISGSNAVKNVTVTFRGCEGTTAGGKCQSTETAGEIQLGTLKGKLGFINKAATPREVGLLLEPAKAKAKFTTYKCTSLPDSFTIGMGNEKEGCVYPQKACGGDGVISAVTPVNTMTPELTQTFTATEETAENIPSKFEGTHPLKVLEGYLFNSEGTTSMWSKVAESLTNSAKTPEAVEIKAN